MIKTEERETLILERPIEIPAIKVSSDKENSKIIKEKLKNIVSPCFTI